MNTLIYLGAPALGAAIWIAGAFVATWYWRKRALAIMREIRKLDEENLAMWRDEAEASRRAFDEWRRRSDLEDWQQ